MNYTDKMKAVIKLNANENPLGCSPKAIETIKQMACYSNLYPGDVWLKLHNKLVEKYEVDSSQLCIFNGAISALNASIESLANAGDELILCVPTYAGIYPILHRKGVKVVEVNSLDRYSTDLAAIKKKISNNTNFLYICNPNNPSGTFIGMEEMYDFILDLPSKVVCIVDEAYIDFCDEELRYSVIDLVKRNCNVVVLRTFSKIYGMAGLRVGYAIGSKENMMKINSVSDMFKSNRLGMAAAIAALDDEEFIKMVYIHNKKQRQFLTDEMNKLDGVEAIPSQGSFVYFKTSVRSDMIMNALQKQNIYIREFANNYMRVSVGHEKENKMFVEALNDILKCRTI